MYTRGNSYFAFGKEQNGMPGGDNIEILSPTPELVSECNTAEKSNDLSIVVRIHHAGQSILLSGDAEQSAWDDMVRFYGNRLKSSFLKASHHGRDTGYHLNALRLIAPIMTLYLSGESQIRTRVTSTGNRQDERCHPPAIMGISSYRLTTMALGDGS